MLPFVYIAITHMVFLNIAMGQSPRCVPVGTCFPQPVEVDPRIVTSEEGKGGDDGDGNGIDADNKGRSGSGGCDAGYESCYPYQGNFECGTRYIANISEADGATRRGAHPWQIYMMNQTCDDSIYIGSGVLLSDRIVLTAAHKVYHQVRTPENIKIYTGVNNPTGIAIPPAFVSQGARIIVHENFKVDAARNKPVDYKNDLALVLLDTPQPLRYRTDLGIACFPRSTDSFLNAERYSCMVGGWGETAFQEKDEGKIHKQVKVPVVPMEICKISMENPKVLGVAGTAKYLDEEKELCAGGENGKDACTQDGGAPLMCYDSMSRRYVVAGLVIWGKGCAQEGVYGVYVDVSKYLDWIMGKMSELQQ